jgi:hypothetical protein
MYFVAGLFACSKPPTDGYALRRSGGLVIVADKRFFCFEAGRLLFAPSIAMGFITRQTLGPRSASRQHLYQSPRRSSFFPRIGAPDMAAATRSSWRLPSCQGPFPQAWHWHLETWRGAMRAPPALMVGASLDRCFRGDRLVIFEHETGFGVSHARNGNKTALKRSRRVRLGGGTLGNGGMAFHTPSYCPWTNTITPLFGFEKNDFGVTNHWEAEQNKALFSQAQDSSDT